MRKIKIFLKALLIVVVSFVILIYGGVFLGHKLIFPIKTSSVPTIEAVTDGRLTLGVQAHASQPKEIADYIKVLAGQLKRYNEIAPSLWPENVLVNQSLIVEEIRKNKFWKIEPDGAITILSKKDALGFGIGRQPYFGGHSFFDEGGYLAVSKEDLRNYLMFQQYLHLGTYDAFITFTHEGFHRKEQTRWQRMGDIPNRGRENFEDNTPARAKRWLLQKQLLKAVSEPGDTQLILDALATYEDWKKSFPEDYKNSVHWDRLEGTAYYYELVSSLYCAYPDQVKNSDDLNRALALLAKRDDIYTSHGLVTEGYEVGGFACVLLDRLDSDWKKRLMDTPEATPIEMLLQHFTDKSLPAPQPLTQTEIDSVGAEIKKRAEESGPSLLFQMLYDLLF
ncbi:MAG: hypothetical protein LBC63_06385 [Holophagales bacterium]|jgi:hypothetical protein|nr:hypothetical protein [Holophagales bacterium]